MVRVFLENVTKRFGDVVAVDNVTLEIKEKEFFVFLGPSGCGKTTTLNMIAGLEPVTSGHIYFDGDTVDDIPPEKRDIAMVFQSYALYPHLNAYDNISFPLKIRKKTMGLTQDQIKERVEETVKMLGISHLMKKRPHEMSGGERQRVALARAIVRRPKVFMMDEPLSNIDAKLRTHMRSEVIRLQKRLATTLIYVTHDQVEAMTMADRICVMNKGKILQVDRPLQIFNRPANMFIGGFVGAPAMNFLNCSLKEKKGELLLETATFSLVITEDIARAIREKATGSELVLGARPGNITVSKDRSLAEDIESEIYTVEPLGTEAVLTLMTGEDLIKAIAPPTFSATLGEKAWFSIDKEKMHIFDRKTGECLV